MVLLAVSPTTPILVRGDSLSRFGFEVIGFNLSLFVQMGVVKVLESFVGQVKGRDAVEELMSKWAQEMREKAWGKEMAELVKGGRK